ncbi:MAG: discoidin domain-containing protein [Ilumatobacteraceae bacterium]
MSDRGLRRGLRDVSFGVAASVVLLAAGCGADDDGGSTSTGVHPFAEVQVDEFVFEADPTNGERGVFRVSTTEPMICAIVWGETEELGRFNNSLAMNGTGIVDHDVFLPGAVAGRTYYFRVQGSTADGTLYQSDMATFTIPGPRVPTSTDSAGRGKNLALDATILEVSSEFSDGFAAANAIDDSGTTEWATAGDGDDAFIVLDLGEEREIAGVEFITRSMLDGSSVTETFSVTIDDAEPAGPFPAGTPVEPNTAALDKSGRVVRVDVDTSTGGNVGAVEIRVLAP